MGAPFRLRHLVATGAVVLLVIVSGLLAGFATRSAAEPESSASPSCPASPAELAPEPSPRQPPRYDKCAGVAAQPADTPLRGLAGPRDLRIGSAAMVDALAGEAYRTTLAREFSAITAEDSMKWSAVEPIRGVYDRRAADQLIAFAEQHDQEVYGHTLVWHKQIPEWVTTGSFSDDELRDLLRRRIEDEVSYFRGDVWAWDVVNEAIAPDGTLRESIWLQRLGPEYIGDAFRWARAADPSARLFINDFGIEGINAKSDGLYQLVRDLLEAGVPIDGIGFQMHWTLAPLPGSLVANMQRFAALGLDIAITELDVRMPEPATPEKLEQQAGIYSGAVGACLQVPACVSITVWGFSDAHSWVPRAYPGKGVAAIFDENFRPKPAYHAVAEALRWS